MNERCKRHIAIKATDPQKALLVLEEKLHTENFKLMPDGTIRLYDYLDDLEKVAAVLSDAHQALFISRILPMGQLRLIALQQFTPSMVQFVFTDFLWIFILYFGAYLGFRHSDLK